MWETVEFRVFEDDARKHLRPNEGVGLGELGQVSVRKLELDTSDPRVQEIAKLQQEYRRRGDVLFSYSRFHRRYTREELEAAELFHLRITAAFEPTGVECGTLYDESAACPICGAGNAQNTDLRLDLRKAPRKKDIARTIADEWIVSQHLAERMINAGLSGFELRPVRHKAKYEDDPLNLHHLQAGREILQKAEVAGAPHPTWGFWVWLNRAENRVALEAARTEYASKRRTEAQERGSVVPVWYQLVITSRPIEMVPPTRFGFGPFDEDLKGEFVCPKGHVSGRALMTKVTVDATTLNGSDVMISRQLLGWKQGVLMPAPLLLISPKFYQLLTSERIKGCTLEVAHLRD
jgi:hypothetical protein